MEIIVNNIKYQLDTDKKTAVVIGYKGESVEGIISEYVDYENEKYKVTSIGYNAFQGCESLKSITIPNSVTYIGVLAFGGCYSLTSIDIPNSVTYIGRLAFYNCKNLTSITIPDSVTSIGDLAFKYSPLKEMRIPKNCTEFYGRSFKETVNVIIDENNPYYFNYQDFIFKFIDDENISLTRYQGNDSKLQIPEIVNYKEKDYKVTEIGLFAFYQCNRLTSIDIPNSVTSIGTSAFQGCSSLTSITIPDSVTFIGKYAFYNCNSLTSITIPDSVTYIGNWAFYNIGLTLPKRYTKNGKLIAYKAFNADMTCKNFQYEEGKSFEIEGGIKLCECGFHACTNPLDIFNYYFGEIGNNMYIHEVYLSGDIDEENNNDSKVCSSKIEIGRRLTIKDINEIINDK